MGRMATHRSTRMSFRPGFVFAAVLVSLIVGIGTFATTRSAKPCTDTTECPRDISGEYEYGVRYGDFHGFKFSVPQATEDIQRPDTSVLGNTDAGNKHIYVDLSRQRVIAKEGDRVVYDFLVSTGKWGRTPTGTFAIWTKLRYTRMAGGSVALGTYYNLPNVPYTMYFYKGYGLHGTYWHNNFGVPMSHGCVNMKTPEAGLLFDWAPVGTPVTIYGVSPSE